MCTMYKDFIPFEPSVQQPDSSQDPGLLFVVCDQPNGRTQERNKARLRRHVMRRHLHLDGSKGQSTVKTNVDQDLDSHDRESSPVTDQERLFGRSLIHEAADIFLGNPKATVGDAMGPLPLPFETDYDAKSILKWMAAGHDSMQAKRFKMARWYYLHDLWRLASAQKVAFDGLAVYACRKKMQLTGDSTPYVHEYLKRKGNLIHEIQREIKKGGTLDSSTLFAIIVLASCSALEREPREGAVHLAAIRSMCAHEHSASPFWTYIWIADLRIALHTDQRPVLDYKKLDQLQKDDSQHVSETPTRKEAVQLASLSPRIKNNFTLPQSADLFDKLLRLCTISVKRAETTNLPVHELYDIEYEIRTVHACVLESSSGPNRTCVELVILAIQLSIWIAGRFFAPLVQLSISSVLGKASFRIASISPTDLLAAWKTDSQADAVSLFWALSLFSSGLATDIDESVFLPALAHVADYLSISTEEEFLDELRRWPPQNAWNSSRYRSVWARLVEFKGEANTSQEKGVERTLSKDTYVSRAETPFFGPLEFWDL